ncbi:VOC family protein [Galbibacter mesophilus]|uniref:VOC family protein n=1 Tax=Galbibacter mesophilus TaxID=379069 RepID=UPI00191ECC03|nr:VOC family protein [Galbibacter mesophilus]MCM5663158.1 VOC family protein [Galbibacter mesophilus]
MKPTLLIALLATWYLGAQAPSEVYLFDLDKSYRLTNPINISNNPELYDNQPYFEDNNTLVYVSTRNGQTDIKVADLKKGTQEWITNTAGSEYSPQAPSRGMYSAIRLDNDSIQKLYYYQKSNGGYTELVPEPKVGYYTWFDKNTIVSYAINEPSELMVHNLKDETHFAFKQNIGRSIHKIPNTDLVSYVDKSKEPWEIRSFNPVTGNDQLITTSLENSEDYTWTPNGDILMGQNEILYKYQPKEKQKWIPVTSLEFFKLKDITRLAVSPNGKKIAVVVGEDLPEPKKESKVAIIDIGIVVTNMEKSLILYKDVLGMKEVGQFPIDKEFGRKSGLTSGLATEVTVLQMEEGNQSTQLKLMTFGKHKNWYPDYIQQDLGVQYITLHVDNIGPYIERIIKNKIKMLGETPIVLDNGKTFVLIKDYDGTFIEIIGELEAKK